jgi:hypothetical protein
LSTENMGTLTMDNSKTLLTKC